MKGIFPELYEHIMHLHTMTWLRCMLVALKAHFGSQVGSLWESQGSVKQAKANRAKAGQHLESIASFFDSGNKSNWGLQTTRKSWEEVVMSAAFFIVCHLCFDMGFSSVSSPLLSEPSVIYKPWFQPLLKVLIHTVRGAICIQLVGLGFVARSMVQSV